MTTRRPRPKYGEPSAESSANMAAHRERIAAESAMSETQMHREGQTVLVRLPYALEWRNAVVLKAWSNSSYGWVYHVRHPDGREEKVTGQRVRPSKAKRSKTA